jgi:hypothetical protein
MPHSWDNFIIMAGTAAATLIGLLFVAVTILTGFATPRIVLGTRGFLTPTFMQFLTVLLQALAVLAPWPAAWPEGIIAIMGGIAGLGYQVRALVTRRRAGFVLPHWHDHLPYAAVPALAYLSLMAGGAGLITRRAFAPFAVAGAVTLLLFAGAYSAWDLTLFIVRSRDKT